MLERIRKMREQEGFTLIELLIVIVILGILAAIVVFAVNGITNRGQAAACQTDEKTIRAAQEANFAKNNAYASEGDLVANGFLSEQSDLHNTAVSGSTFTVTAVGACA